MIKYFLQARSKLPKRRRRVLPVEQPRRKREIVVTNRRMNALKHQHTHPATHTHPAIFKDAFGSAKIGKVTCYNKPFFINLCKYIIRKALSFECEMFISVQGHFRLELLKILNSKKMYDNMF